MTVTQKKPPSTRSLTETTEARRLVEQAVREIELARATYDNECIRFVTAKRDSEKRGAEAEARIWTIAERLLKKSKAEVQKKTKVKASEEPTAI